MFTTMLEKIFKLKQHKTTVRAELIAGIITFLTMSYILGGERDGPERFSRRRRWRPCSARFSWECGLETGGR
jgi:hypothetical protein